jgi:hypothetical protein
MRPQSWGNGPLLLIRFVFRRIPDLRSFGKLMARCGLHSFAALRLRR